MPNAIRRWIYDRNTAANCFFRSALIPPNLKVMIQITERCNMQCKHCFLAATGYGSNLSFRDFHEQILDKLICAHVRKATLTGGEPLLNPALIDIVTDLNAADIQTGICTNALLVDKTLLEQLLPLQAHFNVSLDGIGNSSHGRFRALRDQAAFDRIVKNISLIGRYQMLNGILVTPNKLAEPEEYKRICDLAVASGAQYMLLNPLSPFGRGRYASDLTIPAEKMNELKRELTAYVREQYGQKAFEVIFVRFPNVEGKKAATCSAGSIPYIFTNGDIAICPYTVFAANNMDNRYSKEEFIIGNVFHDLDIVKAIESYRRTHSFCECDRPENIGCAAIKIARDLPLDATDIL